MGLIDELTSLEVQVLKCIPLASTYSDFLSQVGVDLLLSELNVPFLTKSQLTLTLVNLSKLKYVKLHASHNSIDTVSLGIRGCTWLVESKFVDSSGKLTVNDIKVPESLRCHLGGYLNQDGYFYTIKFVSQEWYNELLEYHELSTNKEDLSTDNKENACCICWDDCTKVLGFQYSSTRGNGLISVCQTCFQHGMEEYDLKEALSTLEMSREDYFIASSKFKQEVT